MTCRFRSFLRCFDGVVNFFSNFLGSDNKFFLLVGYEQIVLVFALFTGAILERGDTIAMTSIVQPLAFILEAVGSFAYSGT